MNVAIRVGACILLATLAASCASTGVKFVPVRDLHPSHLNIAVEAPGTEGWLVTEKRYEAGWRIMFRHEDHDDQSRTRIVFLKADRYDAGGFVRAHGSLLELARSVFEETRSGSGKPRFREKWAKLVRSDIQASEAYHIRIAWEERHNPHYPEAVLILEVVQFLVLHPQDPDEVISVAVSTRRRLEQEPLSADTLASSFLGSMRYTDPSAPGTSPTTPPSAARVQ